MFIVFEYKSIIGIVALLVFDAISIYTSNFLTEIICSMRE